MDTPEIERYADGEVIVTEGIMSQKAYVIRSGEVIISKKRGERNVKVGVLREGDIFGEMGLLQDTVRSATAIAKGNVELGIISKDRFVTLLDECPEDIKLIFSSLSDRLRVATEKLATIGLKMEQAKRAIEAFSTKENID